MNEEIHNVEKLAEEVHKLYCDQYEKDNGKAYWTGGDYSQLDECTKEYDRNIARWHLQKVTALLKHAQEEIALRQTKGVSTSIEGIRFDAHQDATRDADIAILQEIIDGKEV